MNYADRPVPPRGSARRPPLASHPAPAPPQTPPRPTPLPASAQPPNVQGAFLAGLVGKAVRVESLSGGAERVGTLRRYDTFALVLEIGGIERLVYKHSIGAICAVTASP